VVESTHRDPKTRGCGLGDVRFMLEHQALGGKCADLNALFVALARAEGIPARDVYGVRVARSALGYASLGPAGGDITKAQHCRAEFWLPTHGWVPDPQAESGGLRLDALDPETFRYSLAARELGA
jgi:transglutaminase-like putative cysteine protease